MSIVSNDARYAPLPAVILDTPYGSPSDSYHTPSAQGGECCANAGRMVGQWGAIVAPVGTHCPIGVPTCGSAHHIGFNGMGLGSVWGANDGKPPARRLNGGPMGQNRPIAAPLGARRGRRHGGRPRPPSWRAYKVRFYFTLPRRPALTAYARGKFLGILPVRTVISAMGGQCGGP